MKRILIIIFTIAIFLPSFMFAQQLDERFTVPFSDPGKTGKLIVALHRGSIMINAYDGKEVIVHAKTRDNGKEKQKEPSTKDGLRRIPTSNVDFYIRENENVIKVNSDSWKNTIDVHIQVPREIALKLNTHNHGEIVVENVSGDLEIENHNGPITLKNVSGSALANTYNGTIKASFRDIKTDAPMAFSTFNGDVDISFPSNLKASTRIQTRNGEVFTDFDMDIAHPEPQRKERKNGYEIRIENWINGKINGGGPEFMFKNYNGNIYIRKQ